MAYQVFRVEITRDETRAAEPVSIEITAYVDRMPETNEATVGRLSRAWRGVWNGRLSRGRPHPLLRILGRRRVCARGGSARAIRGQLAAQRLVPLLPRSYAGPGCGPTRRRLC